MVGCCFSVFIRRIIYKYVCPFDYTAVCGKWNDLNPIYQLTRTSLVAVGNQTDRPKSVRNHCVIEVFGGVFCFNFAFFKFSVSLRDVFHRTESYIFFLYKYVVSGHEETYFVKGHSYSKTSTLKMTSSRCWSF